MSYNDYLNKTGNISRKVKSSAVNEYGEKTDTLTAISTLVPCRVERVFEKDLLEAYVGGDHTKALFVVYLNMGSGIRQGDIFTMDDAIEGMMDLNGASNGLKIIDVDDAGGSHGHHVECMARFREEID
jgi:hypothetical protein